MKQVNTPSGQLILTRLFCKCFSLSPETAGYSEYTPGGAASLECLGGHWYTSLYDDDTKALRANMLKAQTCPDYEQIEAVTK